jgi:hypothetical protein
MADHADIIDMLQHLAEIKGQADKAPPARLALYAELLAGFPREAVAGAIRALMLDTDPFFPQVGAIIAAIPAPKLDAEEAWRLARATLAGYQPQTRPHPKSGNPAVDGAIRALGGPEGCSWEDGIGQGIARRRFLEEYARQAATPEHTIWALGHGPREVPMIPGLEIPEWQAQKLIAAAAEAGRELPEGLRAAIEGRPERALVPGREEQAALPRPARPPLPPERREEIKAEIADGIAKLAEKMVMPA